MRAPGNLQGVAERLADVVKGYGECQRCTQHDGGEIADNTLGISDLTIGDLRRCSELIWVLRGALADIAYSHDMTLGLARAKARRIYEETA